MEGKKKTASGTEKEAALAELDRVERELAELGPDPALEADKKRPRLEICNERLEEFLSFEKGKDQEGRSKEYFAYQMFAGH